MGGERARRLCAEDVPPVWRRVCGAVHQYRCCDALNLYMAGGFALVLIQPGSFQAFGYLKYRWRGRAGTREVSGECGRISMAGARRQRGTRFWRIMDTSILTIF